MAGSQTKRDIALILAASFFYMASPMLITPIITGFSESLGASGVMMGFIGGIMNICSLVSRPFIGVLVDRISKYKLSSFGIFCVLLSCIGYFFAQSPALIVAARIINGLGFACCSTCLSTWMSDLLPPNKIGSGMGIFGTMNALSMAIAPAAGISIYQLTNHRTAFFIAAVTASLALIIVQFVKNRDEAPAQPAKRSLQFFDKNVFPIAFIMMMFGIPYCATQSFLVSYAEARHLSVSISLFFPAYAAALLILRLSLKNYFDTKPFGMFFAASIVSTSLALYFLATMQTNAGLLAAAVFMAGGNGIMFSVCQSTAMLLAPKNKRGLANSTFYIGIDVGMSLGPIIAGFFYQHFAITLFYPLFFFSIPLAIIAFLVYRHIAKKLKQAHA